MNLIFQPSFLFPALAAWSGQVLVLTAMGALGALALTHPKARLLLWQGLLAAMLLLPLVEPWKHSVVHFRPGVTTRMIAATAPATVPVSVVVSSFRWRADDWLWLILAGAILRMLWVAAGFWKLRRYRKQASPLREPPLRFASQAADWYASDAVPGPVTYGWRRPVILLPSRVLDLPAELREAVQCHELIHVHRGDWLFVLCEALVRSVLWFHPAIWFVLGRIQLAREQVVDREAVELLRDRETYLDALVAVASQQLQPELSPALLFLRKRQLLARVEGVVKEIKMSRSKILAASAAVCSAVPFAVWAGMWMFPLVGSAQIVIDDPGVTVNPGAPIVHREAVHAPVGSTVSGTVVIDATIDERGDVSDAHVVSGPEALRKPALTSVLQWSYAPGHGSVRVQVSFQAGWPSIALTPPAPAAPAPAAAQSSPSPVYRPGGDVTAPIPTYKAQPEYSEEARKAKWQGSVTLTLVIDESGMPRDIKILRSLGLGLDEKAVEAVTKWRFQPGLKNGIPVPVTAMIEVTFRLPEIASNLETATYVVRLLENELNLLKRQYTDEHPDVRSLQAELDRANRQLDELRRQTPQ